MMVRLVRATKRPLSPRSGVVVALVAVFALLAGSVGAITRLQTSPNDPSPARGRAQVIAHGVSPMPGDPVAWRVVRDEAPPLDEAEPVDRALGFALADRDAVVVNDLTSGLQTRLAGGEASFVPSGAVQQRASLTGATVAYDRIALVPASEAGDAGGGDLFFAGSDFAAPDGRRDLDLVRDVLDQGEETNLDDTGYPSLVYVTAGELEVTTADASTSDLGAGEAAEYEGDLILTGLGESGATFVAALIGPDVPPPPRFTGSITLGVYACPPGATSDDLDNAGDFASTDCDPVMEGFDIVLLTPDDQEIPLSRATRQADGVSTWGGLPFGDYRIGKPSQLPEGVTDVLLYDGNGDPLDTGEVTIDRDAPDARVNLFLFLGEQSGSISLRVFICPPGMAEETLDTEQCEQITEGFDIAITSYDGQIELSLADATLSEGVFTWAGLPVAAAGSQAGVGDPGSYQIVQTTLPPGVTSYVIPTLPEADDGYAVVLTAEQPDRALELYNFQGEASGAGTITVTGYLCPSAESSDDDCLAGEPVLVAAVVIQGPDGVSLTPDNAVVDGSTYVWSDLALGDYGLLTGELIVPDGSVLRTILGTLGGTDYGYAISLTDEAPATDVLVLLDPTAVASPEASA